MTQASRKGELCFSYSHAPPRSLNYGVMIFSVQAILGYPPTVLVLYYLPSVSLVQHQVRAMRHHLTTLPPSCLAMHGWWDCTHDQTQLWRL